MKNLIILISILVFSTSLFGQWTKGGTEKNYEKYRIIRDTIVTIDKKYIPIKNSSYKYFTIGLVSLRDAKVKSLPTEQEMLVGTSLLGPLFESGKMGLIRGVNYELGGIRQIQLINEHLIPNIDIGFDWDISFTGIKSSINSLKSTSAYSDLYNNFLNEYQPSKFRIFGFKIGPSVTIIPDPKSDLIKIDLFLKAGITTLSGGVDDYVYHDETIYLDNYYYQSEIITANYNRLNTFMTPIQLGFNVRIANSLVAGIQYNTNLHSSEQISEDLSITSTNNFDFGYSTQTSLTYHYNTVNLKNITFCIGFMFGTK